MTLLTLLKATSGGGGVPVALRSSSTTGVSDSNSSSCTIAVPSGATSGDIAVLILEQWESGNPTVTYPSGFAEKLNVVSGSQKTKLAWKRLTGGDAGNYVMTWTGTQFNQAHCLMISGAIATGDPFEATNTATGTSTTIPSTSVTIATQAFLIHCYSNENSSTGTPPTSFTEQHESNYLKTNYRIPGSTGTFTASGGTQSTSTLAVVALAAIMPDAGGGTAGTIAVTQAADTSSAAGQLGYSGTSARTQANNMSAAAGQLGTSGTVARAQASQTSTATGQLGSTGTAAPTQAAQTSSASGLFTAGGSFAGSVAVTQANQTSTASGQLGYSGTVARTQAANTSTAAGAVVNPVTGTAPVTQASQVAAASGKLGYTGTAGAIEALDTAVAAGAVINQITGAVAATQADQTASIAGYFTALVEFGTSSAGVGAAPRSTPATGAAPAATGATSAVPTSTGA